MKDYLKLWADDLLKQNSIMLKSKVAVIGERNQHLGPRWEFAKIQISVEPASNFEVIDNLPANDGTRQLDYLNWAVFGLLDILMVAESAPLKNIRIIIENIEHHAIDSSPMAFRQAGRDAGQKIIEICKHNLFA